MWRPLRHGVHTLRTLARREDASVEIEYVLTLALVILPLILTVPAVLTVTNASFYRRADLVLSSPYP
jgi:hypothetical protein